MPVLRLTGGIRSPTFCLPPMTESTPSRQRESQPSRRARLRRPPRLASGARVALVAPAGPLRGEEDLERAIENTRALGWDPVVGSHALTHRGYLAGTDAERAADLNGAIVDAEVDAIWCLRGGYGVMRILDAIEYGALRARPKPLIGFSDITALHMAVLARAGVATFHGPTARGTLTEFTRRSLLMALVDGRNPCGLAPAARVLHGGRARGPLIGGNLAVLSALIATPFAARVEGAILVLEDVNEPVYRIDRMLQQLRLSGALRRCAGLVFGAFTERGAGDDGAVESLGELLQETADRAGVPCLCDAPVGHIEEQWTLPLGLVAELDADARFLAVSDE